ncbi:MAG: hypothetical protein R3359_02425, partial [Marinirhabdus sp.]|nr:hypothetical protein [Marinirhabdus sp.]
MNLPNTAKLTRHNKITTMILSCRRTLYFSTLLLINASCAQNTFKGTVENWNNEEAEIILPTNNPIVIGTISENGRAEFWLSEETANAVIASMEITYDNAEIRTSSSTVNKTFYCDPEMVNTTNGEIPIQKLASRGTFYAGNLQKETIYG